MFYSDVSTAISRLARTWFLLSLAVGLLLGCGTVPPSTPVARGVSRLSSEQAHDVAIFAMGLVGTPYRYGGNTPEGGFDCSGLIGYVVGHSAEQAVPRTVARLAGFGQSVALPEIRSGDLLLFGAATPWHAGIYVGEGRFVHAPSSGGVVRLDRLDNRYWARQSVQVRRL